MVFSRCYLSSYCRFKTAASSIRTNVSAVSNILAPQSLSRAWQLYSLCVSVYLTLHVLNLSGAPLCFTLGNVVHRPRLWERRQQDVICPPQKSFVSLRAFTVTLIIKDHCSPIPVRGRQRMLVIIVQCAQSVLFFFLFFLHCWDYSSNKSTKSSDGRG